MSFYKQFIYLAPLLLLSCHNNENDADNSGKAAGGSTLSYKVIKQYPHDTLAFTQGLEFYKGGLYEGTGEESYSPLRSELRKLDLTTGKVLKKVDLDTQYFGEG